MAVTRFHRTMDWRGFPRLVLFTLIWLCVKPPASLALIFICAGWNGALQLVYHPRVKGDARQPWSASQRRIRQ